MQEALLLQYRITKPLGEGAMGSVFLAEDTRLKRAVALKLLKEELCRDRESISRFQVEAEAAARLNHPGIATVYAVEETMGKHFIAMEYIAGKSLKNQIPAGGLELKLFFKYFIMLAEAITHAHEMGIIHRDIKPANIIVTPEGLPKLLDFGLARIQSGADASRPCLTMVGTIMGSPAYMSPEQALGRPLDHRSDLFSFGVVMYEALTGKKAFRGHNFQELIAAITRDTPDSIESIRRDIPPLLAHILKKCLQKDTEERYQTARDVLNDLRSASEEKAETNIPIPVRKKTVQSYGLPAAAFIFVLLVSIFAAWRFFLPENASNLPHRVFRIPMEGMDTSYSGGGAAISPDGCMIAFVADEKLCVMDLDTGQRREITDARKVERQPFWSPDSSSIGYISEMGRYIRKTSPRGGGSDLICDVPPMGLAGTASWGSGGDIIFDMWGGDLSEAIGLMQVGQDGGTPQNIIMPDSQTDKVWQTPCFLPDGKSLLLVAIEKNGSSELMLRSREKLIPLVRYEDEKIGCPVYSPSGHILYQKGDALWAVPFSLKRLQRTGEPFLAAERGTWPSTAFDRTLAYVEGASAAQQLVWVNRKGEILSAIGSELPDTQIGGFSISPNEAYVAMDALSEDYEDIWLMDTRRGARTRLTFSETRTAEPSWIDDTALVFTSEQNGSNNIYRQATDFQEPSSLLLSGEASNPYWFDAGKLIVFDLISNESRRDIFYLPIASSSTPAEKPRPFLKTSFDESMPHLSPDGRHLAYMSNRSGKWEVFVKPFPEGAGEWQISVEGGGYPRWSPKGDELFFATDEGLMCAKVDTHPAFDSDVPIKLFDWKHLGLYFSRRYDVGSDGEKFMAVRETGASKANLVIIQNWNGK